MLCLYCGIVQTGWFTRLKKIKMGTHMCTLDKMKENVISSTSYFRSLIAHTNMFMYKQAGRA